MMFSSRTVSDTHKAVLEYLGINATEGTIHKIGNDKWIKLIDDAVYFTKAADGQSAAVRFASLTNPTLQGILAKNDKKPSIIPYVFIGDQAGLDKLKEWLQEEGTI